MSFAQAQQKWEQSWIHGPADDPLDPYYDELSVLTDEAVEQELRSLRLTLRSPEPEDRCEVVRLMIEACEAELNERSSTH